MYINKSISQCSYHIISMRGEMETLALRKGSGKLTIVFTFAPFLINVFTSLNTILVFFSNPWMIATTIGGTATDFTSYFSQKRN